MQEFRIFRKYWRRPAGQKFCMFSTYNNLFITGCMSVSEDNFVDWVFPLSVEETDIEKICLPLLHIANKKPCLLPLCWLLGKGPDWKGWLIGLTNCFIILGFLCSPVNIDLDFCLALVIFESCSSNFFQINSHYL